MADYVYSTTGGACNGTGRFGGFIYPDGLNRHGYNAKVDPVYRDHVCRPVIVDADGRTRPGVVVLPAEHNIGNFIAKTETVVEHVYAPSAYAKVPPPNHGDGILDYQRSDDSKCKPGAFSSDQISKVSEFISSVQTDASAPGRTGFPSGMFLRRAGGGWNGARAGPAVGIGNTVTRPTNDIGEIADYVKETGRAPRPMVAPVAPVFPMKEMTASETIDSREAQRRYGKLPAPGAKKDPSLPTIDSRDAARIYGGRFIE